MVEDGKSIISYVQFDNSDDWDTVFALCSGYITNSSKQRLRKIAVKAVIIEREYIDKDYRNTFSKFHSTKFVTPVSRCIRLHVFSIGIGFSTPNVKQWQQAYSGYIILRPIMPNSIGRSLLVPEIFSLNKSYLCCCTESVMVNGICMEIQGFPFISQDTDATVCAQSSLWMLLRFFSNRYKWYKEIYPSDLTNLVKSHPQGRSMPGLGLTMVQMADALYDLTYRPLLYDKSQYGGDFLKYAYNYVESGFPLLLGLPGHVVVAVGHISDFTKNGTVSSYDYFEGFVINDDNDLPYSKITRNKSDNPFGYTLDDIDSFLVPLPKRVFISVDQFEELVANCENYIRNSKVAAVPPLKRMFLTTGRSYKAKTLERYAALPEISNFLIKTPLPHFIWVCEFSEPVLYSTKFQCLGEIIWDATRNVFNSQLGLIIHLPGILIFDNGAALNKEEDYQMITVGSQPYSIYHKNLKGII